MSIFQKSVIKKYLSTIDKIKFEESFAKFKNIYSISKITEIKKMKEEEYQDGFLRDIFVEVLGYTLKPNDNYNLVREHKNQTDSKKADGAILKKDKAVAVIELKSTKTKDLDNITAQAFNYKNNQPECKYVIISNFHKLRFYIDNATEYEEFDLFNLQEKDFKLLYLLLYHENILFDFPSKIKEETKFHEDNVSKKLYQDYSSFKYDVYNNLVKNNPHYDKLTLFKKSQKFLDRLLFIFFAEDTGLVSPNTTSEIIEQWKSLQKLDAYVPLYERFTKFFGYLNSGYQQDDYIIHAYNGGLFAPDEILDNITIDDKVLKNNSLRLSKYDYSSEVDVNILGHIFEHSLVELEEITAELEGTAIDKSKSRRKKDGVFYTPKYITQYIVENTIGKLCTEKRAELGILEIEFDDSIFKKDGNLAKSGEKLWETLNQYKEWLFSLKIIDPACGSGAFLNQALNFLMIEHSKIDAIIAELRTDNIGLFDTDKTILEKNLYGVDINDESVEIAKLSLWLRTAKKGRKLSNLNNNIKCGNSLIDDPKVAGEKAFNWYTEFPQIFQEKEKRIWHVTTATHNSRYSQRMLDLHITTGKAEYIDEKDELVITQTIADMVKESNNKGISPLNIIGYNLCGDHMHLLLSCSEEELPKIVGKIKGRTARERNLDKGINPLVSKGEGVSVSLWTQKFGSSEVVTEEHLAQAVEYIRMNRVKHGLPENPKIEEIKKSFLCSVEHALRPEYTGGFDVVIGNPPYVHLEKIKDTSIALKNANYLTYHSQGDLYCVFVEKGFEILKQKGIISYIMPNKWLQAGYGKPLREYFLKCRMIELIDFGDIQIFSGATTYPCIFTSQKSEPKKEISISVLKETNSLDFNLNVSQTAERFEFDSFTGDTWVIKSKKEKEFLEKLQNKFTKLSDFIEGQAFYGIKTGLTEAFLINEETKQEIINKDIHSESLIKPVLQGKDIKPWVSIKNNNFLIGTFPALNLDIENYLSVKEYLLSFGKNRLEQTGNKGSRKKTNNKWFETQDAIAYYPEFEKPKIMYQTFQVKPCFIYDEQGLYCNNSMWIIPTDNKALLCILNSKMGWWLITKYCTQIQNGCQLIWKYFGQIPIAPTNSNLSEKADQMLSLNKDLQEKSARFINRIKDNLGIEKLSTKLEKFYESDFKTFVSECNKGLKPLGKKLSLVQQDEWEEYFNTYKTEINTLQSQISATDKEIDQMVYELYELTEEEIAIVEESAK